VTPNQTYRPSRCNYIYASYIGSNGVYEMGPDDWSVERTATGTYVITHNLGHTHYVAVIAGLTGANLSEGAIQSYDENTITVGMFTAGSVADARFSLIVFATN
jgi:hypothetical protein